MRMTRVVAAVPGALAAVVGFAALAAVASLPAVAATAGGTTGGAADDALADAEAPRAQVEIDGTVLFSVRGLISYPAEERARAVAGRIRELAKRPAFDPRTLRVEEAPPFTIVRGGDLVVVSISDADARLEIADRSVVATAAARRIGEAITAYRAARTPAALTVAARDVLIATLLLVATGAVFLWLVRRLAAALDRRFQKTVASLTIRSVEVLRADRVRAMTRALLNLTRIAVLAVALFMFLRFTLGRLPWTRGVANRLDGHVFAPLTAMGSGFVDALPGLIFLVILFFITRAGLRVLRLLFDAVADGRLRLEGFDPQWAHATYKLMRLAIMVFAVAIGYPYIPGSSSGAFQGLSLFIGIVFSLGSSSTISNVIAGYSLTYRRAFHEGDRVRIGQVTGDVTHVRLQVTHLKTVKNEEVVIPNSLILNQEVINYTTLARTRGLILHTNVGIGYETPWRQVEAMLLLAAERTPGILRDPKPFVLQTALGDFAVTYQINVYCDDPGRMAELYTQLHRQILDVFNEYGVQIMTPAYEGDPERPKLVVPGDWYPPPAAPDRPAAPGAPDSRRS